MFSHFEAIPDSIYVCMDGWISPLELLHSHKTLKNRKQQFCNPSVSVVLRLTKWFISVPKLSSRLQWKWYVVNYLVKLAGEAITSLSNKSREETKLLWHFCSGVFKRTTIKRHHAWFCVRISLNSVFFGFGKEPQGHFEELLLCSPICIHTNGAF